MSETAVSRPLPIAPADQPAPSDARLIEIWLHGRSLHTQRAYAADIRRFCAHAGKPLATVTLADLQSFADSLPDLAPTSRYRTLSAVKSLVGFGHQLGYLPLTSGGPCGCPPSAIDWRSGSCQKPTSTGSSASSRTSVTALS